MSVFSTLETVFETQVHCLPFAGLTEINFFLVSPPLVSAYGFCQQWVAEPGLFETPGARCSCTLVHQGYNSGGAARSCTSDLSSPVGTPRGREVGHSSTPGLTGPFPELVDVTDVPGRDGRKCLQLPKLVSFWGLPCFLWPGISCFNHIWWKQRNKQGVEGPQVLTPPKSTLMYCWVLLNHLFWVFITH